MSAGSIDRIITSIENDVDMQRQAYLQTAHDAGKHRYDEMIADAKKKLKNDEKNHNEELRQLYRRETTANRKEAQKAIDALKNTLAQELISATDAVLKQLDSHEFAALLDRILEKENGSQRPRIRVDSRHFSDIMSSHGSQYQVIEDEAISAGFVLHYADYDIDYEFSHVLRYNNDDFTKIALHQLFGDNQ
ncbi:hypothetical protein G7062_05885 [Erysipelothrix sp. HDW6C]|uniref:hypothetical protein n=1 Tax=Erysipelothrix sp. HDW6C TaxID=2714930 RepID=UPI00140C4D81|nr:hypothetical protein [Erysipelothrix sp. HDW6C]QIK69850.1 hypothetical protein G7062_05885 [Erysipelothrix sp. HDW6C]